MPQRQVSERILVLAPTGRDGAVACNVLRDAGLDAHLCASLPALAEELSGGVGLAMVADEALQEADLRPLSDWVRGQPAWSDLPLVVLTRQGGGAERNPNAARITRTLGNVTFLERPFHPTTLVSVAHSALRGRRRQYEARERLTEVHEAEERLRIALEAGRLGAWQLDLPERRLEASTHCKAHFGRAADEAFTYPDLLASIHPEDRPRMQAAVEQAIATRGEYDISYRCLWPDGSVHWVEVKGRVTSDGSGRPVGMVGVSVDVTDRKVAELERERLVAALSSERAALERRVEERTADLAATNRTLEEEMEARERAQEQLRQSQKIETMGQLVGGVAHDFNNLLMAVMGNLELLGKRLPENPRTHRLLDGAMQGARRGASLTQRLLAFARRQDLQPKATDAVALVSGIMGLLERSVGPLVQMELQAPDALPPVRVDPNQLEMALLNLAVNARDAMPDGGALTITLGVDTAVAGSARGPGPYVRLSVSDTGEGMDPETLRQAIEPFFSTKGVGKGTGLGLSMVHGLAEQSGGAFRLTSEPGRGTTAELWLPVADAAEPVVATPTRRAATGQAATILLVDDDALIAMSTAAMLEDLGHTVIEANSGQNALGALESGLSPDLMITDHAMPGMTGTELVARVRELMPQLPVLLATGYAELPDENAPDLPRLNKPYTQDQLATEIGRLLVQRAA